MGLIINNEYELEHDFTERFELIVSVIQNLLNIKKDYDLSVSLISNEYIREINKQYRDIDKETDVISFAMLDSDDLNMVSDSELDLGDIFISVDQAKIQAADLNQSLEVEIEFLFIHGHLHLLGYDHIEKNDEEIMFDLQRKIVDEINK